MPASPAADPILKRFRAALDALHGDRIERVMPFGSRRRAGGFRLRRGGVSEKLCRPLAGGRPHRSARHRYPIHAMPHRAGSYEDRTSLMREIRREGIDL
jgi:hypothetical protein